MRLCALYRIAAFIALGLSACSGENTSPDRQSPITFENIVGKRYLLTRVSGKRIPAVYYASPDGSFNAWVDSAWITFQSDTIVTIYMFRPVSYNVRDTVSPGNANGQVYSGRYTVSGDTIVTYTNGGPDTATLLPHGGVVINMASHYPDETVPLGTWTFNKEVPAHNPLPHIYNLSHDTVAMGSSDFSLEINGFGFVQGLVVKFGAYYYSPRFFINPTKLKITVPSEALYQAGIIGVTITNPSPGGGTSNIATVTVVGPTPVVTGISPTSVDGPEISCLRTDEFLPVTDE